MNELEKNYQINDNTNELTELYKLARYAANIDDDKNAERYYNIINEKTPCDWESAFYSKYYKIKNFNADNINSCITEMRHCVNDVLLFIKENADDKHAAYSEVNGKLIPLYNSMYQIGKERYIDFEGSSDRNLRNIYGVGLYNVVCNFYYYGDMLESLFKGEKEAELYYVGAWKDGVEIHIALLEYLEDQASAKKEIKNYIKKIKKYIPKYKSPTVNSKSEGCYIATSVYGSYDCPEVWTLRRYRDYTLASTWYGRAFISTYYAVSPTLVKWFGNTGWFKKMWHGKLDRMVKKLNVKGVENTPYNDNKW